MNDLTVTNLPLAVRPSVESSLKWLPRNVASVLATLPERDDVIRECRKIRMAEKPTTPEEFALIIAKFVLHFPENRLSPEEQRMVLLDWRRLLGDMPVDILQSACDAYVMSPARWFPTPGQLFAVAEANWTYRRRLAARANETLALIERAA